MKFNKVLLAVSLVLSLSAFADDGGDKGSSSSGGSQQQLQLQGQVQGQSQYANVTGSNANAGGSSSNVSVDNGRVASSAIAPSVSQYSDCPIVSPSSKAGSIFLFSGSGTTGTTINGICVAKYLGEGHVVQRIACANSKEYHDANPDVCK